MESILDEFGGNFYVPFAIICGVWWQLEKVLTMIEGLKPTRTMLLLFWIYTHKRPVSIENSYFGRKTSSHRIMSDQLVFIEVQT